MHIWYAVYEVSRMAEFCPKCLNKLDDTHYPSWWYILSKELDFCEACQQWKRVVVVTRGAYYRRRLKNFFLKR